MSGSIAIVDRENSWWIEVKSIVIAQLFLFCLVLYVLYRWWHQRTHSVCPVSWPECHKAGFKQALLECKYKCCCCLAVVCCLYICSDLNWTNCIHCINCINCIVSLTQINITTITTTTPWNHCYYGNAHHYHCALTTDNMLHSYAIFRDDFFVVMEHL